MATEETVTGLAKDVMGEDEAAQNLSRLVELGISLSAEPDLDRLLEKILLEAKALTDSDGGTIYILRDDALHFSFLYNDTLKIAMGGTTGKPITFPPLQMFNPENGAPNHKNIATHAALTGEVINVADAYDTDKFDFSGTRKFDQTTGYRSKSFLTVPLKTHEGDITGVLQLINARDETGGSIPFSQRRQRYVEALSSQAAIAIDNKQLVLSQRQVMEAFIEVIAKSIDAKSPHTGAHCQRVPVIVRMLVMAACLEQEGTFADFDLNESEWYTLHLSSWLHDCGKVTTPEYIVDKATKLETVTNRIHEIRTRFELLLRDAEIAYLKGAKEKPAEEPALKEAFEAKKKELFDDFGFIASCNVGGFLPKEKQERLKELAAKHTFVRHFDRTLGLSFEEMERIKDKMPPPAPARERVLQNAPDHLFGGYNRGELYNLQVEKGTLTAEERRKINDHIVQTIKMLETVPFPKELKNIVEYAAGHHERMDGKGYPNGLMGEEMSIPARAMAIADVFEALTATDRPYKKPKSMSETLKIMTLMKRDGHIDPALFDLFLEAGVYQSYGDQYMREDQMDEVDITNYIGSEPPILKDMKKPPAQKAAPAAVEKTAPAETSAAPQASIGMMGEKENLALAKSLADMMSASDEDEAPDTPDEEARDTDKADDAPAEEAASDPAPEPEPEPELDVSPLAQHEADVEADAPPLPTVIPPDPPPAPAVSPLAASEGSAEETPSLPTMIPSEPAGDQNSEN